MVGTRVTRDKEENVAYRRRRDDERAKKSSRRRRGATSATTEEKAVSRDGHGQTHSRNAIAFGGHGETRAHPEGNSAGAHAPRFNRIHGTLSSDAARAQPVKTPPKNHYSVLSSDRHPRKRATHLAAIFRVNSKQFYIFHLARIVLKKKLFFGRILYTVWQQKISRIDMFVRARGL